MAPLPEIFCCHAHKDERFLIELRTHLEPLRREGLVDIYDEGDINVGADWEQEIHKHLTAAQIILFLISPDFMNSPYSYGKKLEEVMRRHEREEARVIPIILRHADWQGSLFGKLQALPTGAKPVTDWQNEDKAFLNIVLGIRTTLHTFMDTQTSTSSTMVQFYQPQNLPWPASQRILVDRTIEQAKGSSVGVATFRLAKQYTIKCELKNLFMLKEITIFIDDVKKYAKKHRTVDLHYGRQIFSFPIEDIDFVCKVTSINGEIGIIAGNEEILKLN